MSAVTEPAASLILGPLLRYVGRTEATLWVETDRARPGGRVI